MKVILSEHKKRYPGMEVRDVVKLLHQSDFCNGHMITEPDQAMNQLEKEYQGVPLTTLNRLFVLSAKSAEGNQTSFEGKLNQLRQWTREGITSFSEAEVESYLTEYQHQGCPVVSHSTHYRNLYQPAYRVIAEAYASHLPMFADIDRMLAQGESNTVLVAIDGQCASGKTTLAALVQQVYDCNLFHMEGAYSCHPYFGPCYHLTYCLTIEAEEQQRRILKRNGEAMLKRFVEEWIPKENAYLEQFSGQKAN